MERGGEAVLTVANLLKGFLVSLLFKKFNMTVNEQKDQMQK